MAKRKGSGTVLDRKTIPEALKKQIEESAYYKWMSRGCPPGNDIKDWTEAEQELLDSLRAKHI